MSSGPGPAPGPDGVRRIERAPELAARAADAHKGDFGTVVVVAGSRGMLGAAVLCARGALRGGAGLVRVGLPEDLLSLLPLAVPEATTFVRDGDALQEQLASADAIVVGPGLGNCAATRRLVQLALRHGRAPIVFDADALNVLAPLTAPIEASAPVVLTPHPGEAARLLSVATADVQGDREAAAGQLCEASGAIVVLKGAGTLVRDAGRCFCNDTGNPGMATGGSGDVLAGLLGALLARGLDPFDAACIAVHVHGRAGDRIAAQFGQSGLCASDLPAAIAEVLP